MPVMHQSHTSHVLVMCQSHASHTSHMLASGVGGDQGGKVGQKQERGECVDIHHLKRPQQGVETLRTEPVLWSHSIT